MIGRSFGHTKWFSGNKNNKTVEGSVALFVSVLLGSIILLSLDGASWKINLTFGLEKINIICCLSICAMIIELISPVNDNIAIPVGCMLLFLLLSVLDPF